MTTRLKRPSKLKQLSITALLIAFQVYLGYSAISGQYGIEGRKEMQIEIVTLKADQARLDVEIQSLRKRIDLFDPERLDPDILTERALGLLSMAHAEDRLVLLPNMDREL